MQQDLLGRQKFYGCLLGYQDGPFPEDLASRINAVEDADLVIMDCLGFSAAMRDQLQARIDKNILLPRSLLYRVACELLGI